MWRYMDQTRWLAALLPALIGCTGGSSQPAAPKASTPAEAVDALIGAIKPIESEDAESAAGQVALFQAIAPHLADSSRETVDCFLAAIPEARDHDLLTKNVFGAALEKAEDYSPAEGFVAMMMSMGTPLTHIPPGAKAEVVKQAEKSPTEVMFRVRWRKGESPKTQSFEDTFVAVQEGGGWKVLLPLFGGVEFGSHGMGDKEEEYFRRKQQEWDATAVRNNNQTATRQLQAFRSKIGRLTQDLKDGKYQRIEAYLDAVNAASEMP